MKYSVTIDFGGEEAKSPLHAAFAVARYLDSSSPYDLNMLVSDEAGNLTYVDMQGCTEYLDDGSMALVDEAGNVLATDEENEEEKGAGHEQV